MAEEFAPTSITFRWNHMLMWPASVVVLGLFAGGSTKDYAAVLVAGFAGCVTTLHAWATGRKRRG